MAFLKSSNKSAKKNANKALILPKKAQPFR